MIDENKQNSIGLYFQYFGKLGLPSEEKYNPMLLNQSCYFRLKSSIAASADLK